MLKNHHDSKNDNPLRKSKRGRLQDIKTYFVGCHLGHTGVFYIYDRLGLMIKHENPQYLAQA